MAQRLYDIAALEPLIRQGFTVLTPNHRLARRIKAQWDADRAAEGGRAWRPLPVHPLETWLFNRWELAVSLGVSPPSVPLGLAQELELWRQVIGAQERQSAEFHLLLPTAAAEIAHQARDTLQRWQVDINDPRIRQLFSLDRESDTFRQWLQSFELRLKKSGLCTLTDCLKQLPAIGARLPQERVALVEFDEIPPLLRIALDAVCIQVENVIPIAAATTRLIHPFTDKRAELQAVAAWAADVHRSDSGTTIGIVPGDMNRDRVALEYLLRREFNCLGENYNSLPVNFSAGIPLAQTPLVRDALAALTMGLADNAAKAEIVLAQSRFVDPQHALSATTQRSVSRLYAAPSAWAARFITLLTEWGWPGRQSLDSVEHQQLELWHRTLDDFRAFDAVCGTIQYSDALALLRDCCSRQLSHPQTADSPIQVLGPLEAAGLTFDHLWLCGMQAASWPASPRPNPFIPPSLQSRRRMPHATPERELAYCTALLEQYSRSSRRLHASYARQIDGVPELPSALLDEFVLEVMPEPPSIPTAWMTGIDEAALEELPDHTAPELHFTAGAAITGGSRILEDQSHCPFRAFARHRLHIPPATDPSAALPAPERGSLLHAALYALWGELGDLATLSAMDDEAQQRAIERAIEAALASISARLRRNIGAAYWRLERQRLAAVLREWLAVERTRGDFSVIAREQEFTLELAELPLRLRVDRIDQLPDGSRVIIDYKSGQCSVRDWLGDRPAKPQLLLYAVAEPDATAALAFARVAPRDCGYVGLGEVAAAPGIATDIARASNNRMVAGDWRTLNDRWRNNLERLARAFTAGEAQVDPLRPASCDHCGLQPLCRVASSSTVNNEEAL